MDLREDFDLHFKLLTDHGAFPWQRALFDEFMEKRFPKTCDIPTGLGKTSTIALWLLALAYQANRGMTAEVPRRLVYVVNRRTVVDQATREAEQIRKALHVDPELHAVAEALKSLAAVPSGSSVAISTLRGQFADNSEWRNDPARPAIIVGTVDMIGSRLLFSGYGCGFKSRPLHAGFLGQDSLLVHDEAHLEPAFQDLVCGIEIEQLLRQSVQTRSDSRRFRVMALSATSRGNERLPDDDRSFRLTDADWKNELVSERLRAKKGIELHYIDDEKKMADELSARTEYKESGQAILIFLRKLEHVEKITSRLRGAKLSVQSLTGTMRGLERDALALRDEVFARFMPKPLVTPKDGAVYLVCTAAGEVGIDISADHMICDLTPFDSMAQRFGRVNRFGKGDACIHVAHSFQREGPNAAEVSPLESENAQPEGTSDLVVDDENSGKTAKPPSPFDLACERTLSLLQHLPKREDGRYDACPAALGELPVDMRRAAFSPSPSILPVSDILFDNWALTSICDSLPGRPPVAAWLHGVAEWEPPETSIAWREEVGVLTGELLEGYNPGDLLDDYPLKPHEILRDRTDRVLNHLARLATTLPSCPVWLVADTVSATTLSQLIEDGKEAVFDRTVLLPPEVGGIEHGLLDGHAVYDAARRDGYDVADDWKDENDRPRRLRIWNDDARPAGMRLVRTIDASADADDEGDQTSYRRYWFWFVRPSSADDDGSRTAKQKQDLEPHLQSAEYFARVLATKLLNDPEASAIRLAAKWHDRGKDREIWQRSIGNRNYPQQVLAKSGGTMWSRELSNFRHEFGSLIDVSALTEFVGLDRDAQDLILHLIASHHGRARPHFRDLEVFDPKHCEKDVVEIAREVPRRFARLQRVYGRWGLAYLESLVRVADALASQANDVGHQCDTFTLDISTQKRVR